MTITVINSLANPSFIPHNKNMREPVNPLNDFFFRYLLGSPGHEDLCLSFINAVLGNSHFPLAQKITLQNPFNLKEDMEGKESILDIKVEAQDREIYDIEVQTINRGSFDKRALYYWSKNYTSQLPQGGSYAQLHPVVLINLLGYIAWKEVNKAHSWYLLREGEDPNFVLTTDLVIHYVELPKLEESSQNLTPQLKAWLRFLSYEGTMKEKEMHVLIKNEPLLEKAHELYQRFSGDNTHREAYENRLKNEIDRISREEYVKEQGIQEGLEQGIQKGKQQGLEQGIQKGKQQGLEQGIQQGIQKGKQQGLEQGMQKGRQEGLEQGKLETAKRLLTKKDISVEEIASLTDLSIAEVEKLKT